MSDCYGCALNNSCIEVLVISAAMFRGGSFGKCLDPESFDLNSGLIQGGPSRRNWITMDMSWNEISFFWTLSPNLSLLPGCHELLLCSAMSFCHDFLYHHRPKAVESANFGLKLCVRV